MFEPTQIQSRLRQLPDDALRQMLRGGANTGVPEFYVLTELNRRMRMRDDVAGNDMATQSVRDTMGAQAPEAPIPRFAGGGSPYPYRGPMQTYRRTPGERDAIDENGVFGYDTGLGGGPLVSEWDQTPAQTHPAWAPPTHSAWAGSYTAAPAQSGVATQRRTGASVSAAQTPAQTPAQTRSAWVPPTHPTYAPPYLGMAPWIAAPAQSGVATQRRTGASATRAPLSMWGWLAGLLKQGEPNDKTKSESKSESKSEPKPDVDLASAQRIAMGAAHPLTPTKINRTPGTAFKFEDRTAQRQADIDADRADLATQKKRDFNSVLMNAGVAMMGSDSPYFMSGLARGAEAGLGAYESTNKDRRARHEALRAQERGLSEASEATRAKNHGETERIRSEDNAFGASEAARADAAQHANAIIAAKYAAIDTQLRMSGSDAKPNPAMTSALKKAGTEFADAMHTAGADAKQRTMAIAKYNVIINEIAAQFGYGPPTRGDPDEENSGIIVEQLGKNN